MKCIILAIFCVSAYGQAAVSLQNHVVDITIGPQELHLKAGSDLVTEDDQLLLQELVSMELSERNAIANLIRDMLEGLRELVIYGNDNLPPLDPLNIETIGPLEFSTTGIRVTAQLDNFNMQGLRWYVVDDVTFNALRLALGVKITIPWIILTGSYDAHTRITLMQHRAGGNFRLSINRFESSVYLRMGTNILGGGTLILRELNIDLKIHDVQVNFEGMVGSNVLNGLINSMIQNAAHNLLVEELHAVGEMLSKELFDAINQVLSNFTLDDLLGN